MMRTARRFIRNPFPRALLLLMIGMAFLSFMACTSAEDPNEDETTDTDIANIMVYNDYGETLDIYMNGTFQFTLQHDESEDVDDVALDEYTMQAKLAGTDQIVDEEEIDVSAYTTYTWTIDDPPDINIINDSGIDLMIYINDQFIFNLVDEENRWVMNVAYGEYTIKAIKVSNDAEYSSITLEVNDNIDYSWTIY
jgi:hypothetical protein